MILAHYCLENPIELNYLLVNVLVIENEKRFYDFCKELLEQTNGGEGNFIFYDDSNKPLQLVKTIKMFADPFNLSINDKKSQNILFSIASDVVENSLNKEYLELKSKLFAFFDKLNGESYFAIEYEEKSEVQALLKAFGVEWRFEDGDLCETLISLIHFHGRILNTKCMVFVNLKCFLNEFDLKKVYKAAHLDNMPLLLLESTLKHKIDSEKVIVIDKDLCEIIV